MERDLFLIRYFLQFSDRCFSDTPLGFVDNTEKREIIVRIGEYSEIGDDIFDFGAFIKAHTPYQLETKPLFGKSFFQRTGERIDPVKYSDIIRMHTLREERFDLSGNRFGFMDFIERVLKFYLGPIALMADEIFAQTVAVVLDQGIGCQEDGVC